FAQKILCAPDLSDRTLADHAIEQIAAAQPIALAEKRRSGSARRAHACRVVRNFRGRRTNTHPGVVLHPREGNVGVRGYPARIGTVGDHLPARYRRCVHPTEAIAENDRARGARRLELAQTIHGSSEPGISLARGTSPPQAAKLDGKYLKRPQDTRVETSCTSGKTPAGRTGPRAGDQPGRLLSRALAKARPHDTSWHTPAPALF